MKPRDLAGRTGRLFAWTVTLFLVAVAFAMAGAYRLVIVGELDDELEELLLAVEPELVSSADGPRDGSDLRRILDALVDSDDDLDFAFRVQGKNGFELGPAPLLREMRSAPAGGGTLRLSGAIRFRRLDLPGDLRVEAALDGSAWIDRSWLIFAMSMGAAAVGGLLSLVVGRRLGRQVAGMVDALTGVRPQGAFADAPEEIQRAAEVLREERRRTAAEVERARLLSAGLAHDLRAPVQALLTRAQVARMSRTAVEGQDAASQESELRDLARTIDNIVAFGAPRIEGETSAAHRAPVDLADALRVRIEAERAEAASRGVLLDVITGPGPVEVVGDEQALVLAIRNLLSNAIQWSPAGGEVQVRVSRGAGGTGVTVRVDDAGPGIPEAERAAILRPFTRGAAAPERRAGYGLGLFLVAQVTEWHGGAFEIGESDLGGARVELRLP